MFQFFMITEDNKICMCIHYNLMLVSSVIIKKYIYIFKAPHKVHTHYNTATCSAVQLEINLSETVETALSKLFLAVKAG